MFAKLIQVFLLALVAITNGFELVNHNRTTYDNFQVLRCDPQTRAQLDSLYYSDLNFWMEPRRVGAPVDIMVNRADRANVEAFLKGNNIACRTMIENVETVVDKEFKLAANKDVSFLENYHPWNEVYEYFDGLASSFPSRATTSTIGKTYMGKDIKIITITSGSSTGRPTLWFDSGLHAREWITVGTMTYVADTLVKGYGSNKDVTDLLDKFDIIICPIANADGYDYTWTDDRMWRKTRSPNEKSSCVGTDPNRNWAFHWGEAGSNNIKCSDQYMGSKPASEVEVATIQKYICDHKSITGYINFHSYSQTWMSPWGWTADLPVDYTIQNGLSKVATEAIKAVHGTVFEYGPIATAVYPASGSSADYTYGVCGIKYSYGAELRDTGDYGFLLPADQIVPSGEEIFAAISAMGKYIAANP